MARKSRRRLMPNNKGPQIQIKDKRNPSITTSHHKLSHLNSLSQAEAEIFNDAVDHNDREEIIRSQARVDQLNAQYLRVQKENPRIEYIRNEVGDVAYVIPNDTTYVNNHRHGILSKPKGSAYNKGDYTGATRAPHPVVHRPFGNNTREAVYPFDKQGTKLTGVLDNHYDPKVLSPPGQPSAARGLIPPGATTLQAGTPSVLRGVTQLRPGSNHWLFS